MEGDQLHEEKEKLAIPWPSLQLKIAHAREALQFF
jgi:hypothetical protein